MFSLLAFKALRKRGDVITSPQFVTPWHEEETPWGKFLVARANPGDFEAGNGIHAGLLPVAKEYGSSVFLVAPHPDYRVEEASDGWRAEAAICLGNLRSLGRKNVARTIVAAYRAGYPQIKYVTLWAAYTARDAEVLITEAVPRHLEWLTWAGAEWEDRFWTPAITEALIASGCGESLFAAGWTWPDSRWTPAITSALVSQKKMGYLHDAMVHWPDDRWSPAILDTLVASGSGKWLYETGRYVPDSRWSPAIAQALAAVGDEYWIESAKLNWPADRLQLLLSLVQ